jgi:2-dehydro-3-deoxyphosphogluconate aldolase/(4S)-4-hydroxy-2-oxoglutarate aldolase
MTKDQVRARIEEIGIIPVVRSSTAEDALFAAEAVSSAGIPIVEVTMTVPGAIEVMSELARQSPQMIVGAGTVFDVDAAHRCLDAGAAFLTTPGLDLEIVDFALKRGVVVIPGALTPSEVMLAWKAGSDFVKVFPCAQVGGASYIRALKGPFPQVPLIASGGVNQQTVADFIRAGAVAVGIGRDLIQPRAIRDRERNWIRELAHRYVQMVKQARAEIQTH